MPKVLFSLVFIFVFTPVLFAYAQADEHVPVRILLVPGHDKEVWGAQYGNVKEAAMNLAVASRIHTILRKDKRFEVFITRTIDGLPAQAGYVPEFAEYFSTQRAEILAFRENAKKEMRNKIGNGNFLEKEGVPHNTVTEDVSVVLYGINKWATENSMDAVIHIHFNDYPRENKWTIGKHRGFAVYFPDGQLPNFKESASLAADVYIQLEKKYNTSTYERELGGLVADQKLIALGANGTLGTDVRSVLIEYGYMYEKRFRNYTTRHQAYADMAKLTAQGLKNYFFPKK